MRSALSLALGPKSARRTPLALALGSLCAINAYGWSSVSLSHPSTGQKEKMMSFVVWLVLGLAAGFVGSRLANKGEQGVPADVLVGVVGAVAAGWLYYAFGPPGVNGFNLFSHFAAVIGSLVFLLTYYAIRRG
jgi:uncharacterized membrane protein YeaQ/YmgE (transglycosylase-associated protein family)